MQIGFIGLGRMGANMVRRLLRDGHEIVAYNRSPEKTHEIAAEGAQVTDGTVLVRFAEEAHG